MKRRPVTAVSVPAETANETGLRYATGGYGDACAEAARHHLGTGLPAHGTELESVESPAPSGVQRLS